MGNDPQESLENTINTNGYTVRGTPNCHCPLSFWFQKQTSRRCGPRTHEAERTSPMSTSLGSSQHTRHLASPRCYRCHWGQRLRGFRWPRVFRVRSKHLQHLMWLICRNHGTVGQPVRCKDWGWTSETVTQPISPQGSTQRDNNRVYIYSRYKDSLLRVGWPSPM